MSRRDAYHSAKYTPSQLERELDGELEEVGANDFTANQMYYSSSPPLSPVVTNRNPQALQRQRETETTRDQRPQRSYARTIGSGMFYVTGFFILLCLLSFDFLFSKNYPRPFSNSTAVADNTLTTFDDWKIDNPIKANFALFSSWITISLFNLMSFSGGLIFNKINRSCKCTTPGKPVMAAGKGMLLTNYLYVLLSLSPFSYFYFSNTSAQNILSDTDPYNPISAWTKLNLGYPQQLIFGIGLYYMATLILATSSSAVIEKISRCCNPEPRDRDPTNRHRITSGCCGGGSSREDEVELEKLVQQEVSHRIANSRL